jgi:hypothetical protein
LIGHDHPNKPANGERMIRQSWAVWRSDHALFYKLARDRTQNRTSLLLIARRE